MMTKFKIKYIEGNTINKSIIVEAENSTEAITKFQLENQNVTDIISVEVEDD